jgi:uroporphyrinogen-III decarboxylase
MGESLIHKDRTLLKAIYFERPDYIPMTFHVNDACYSAYPRDALFDLMEEHTFLFPGFVRPGKDFVPDYLPNARAASPWTDSFGCVWTTLADGITGAVKNHPLDTWEKFASYQMPNPQKCDGMKEVDWNAEKAKAKKEKEAGRVVFGGLRHGHTFLQLCDIRGYENVLIDMVEEEPNLLKLIERLEEFNMAIVNHYIEMDCDIITYAEDLGMQYGPMISPELFRKFIKPSYERLMKPARDRNIAIHMHSDGDIRLLAADLIDGGVNVLNLQDMVNGIDWIAVYFAGRVCVDLDIDRARVTAQGSPADIDRLIYDEVTKIGRKEGGLTMIYGLYPNVPLANVKALMDAMEKYAFHFS